MALRRVMLAGLFGVVASATAPADYQNQVIDVVMEDGTDSDVDAWKQFAFDKDAAVRRENVIEMEAASTAKMQAAISALDALSKRVAGTR
eukprot:TRINITY_DN25197_c0_g1_i1.p1 TRINITY_DN25197_c0_g1~~TRINITY_DN25197_c0_g1_i1.p1  ORF type:complete len:102 (+),score=19.92 TRINITY_DN25197_c0_g1_i1:37-306(+)